MMKSENYYFANHSKIMDLYNIHQLLLKKWSDGDPYSGESDWPYLTPLINISHTKKGDQTGTPWLVIVKYSVPPMITEAECDQASGFKYQFIGKNQKRS